MCLSFCSDGNRTSFRRVNLRPCGFRGYWSARGMNFTGIQLVKSGDFSAQETTVRCVSTKNESFSRTLAAQLPGARCRHRSAEAGPNRPIVGEASTCLTSCKQPPRSISVFKSVTLYSTTCSLHYQRISSMLVVAQADLSTFDCGHKPDFLPHRPLSAQSSTSVPPTCHPA